MMWTALIVHRNYFSIFRNESTNLKFLTDHQKQLWSVVQMHYDVILLKLIHDSLFELNKNALEIAPVNSHIVACLCDWNFQWHRQFNYLFVAFDHRTIDISIAYSFLFCFVLFVQIACTLHHLHVDEENQRERKKERKTKKSNEH